MSPPRSGFDVGVGPRFAFLKLRAWVRFDTFLNADLVSMREDQGPGLS